jgi:hypothetical protein
MKIKDLIKELKKMPQDYDIILDDFSRDKDFSCATDCSKMTWYVNGRIMGENLEKLAEKEMVIVRETVHATAWAVSLK